MTGPAADQQEPRVWDRAALLEQAQAGQLWDILIIGGGATGLGCAVDAAQRGYHTLLVEQHDFAKGTSSRSTKLIHGGLRYLAQGNLRLVREALHERHYLRGNAPALVKPLPFAIPFFHWWDRYYYPLGVWAYESLAAEKTFPTWQMLDRQETFRRLPGLRPHGLRGSVLYYDGQFDDARLAVALARTALQLGACLLNYTHAVPKKERGKIVGLSLHDRHTGQNWDVRGRVVINATGIFADQVRRQVSAELPPLLVHSQGTHIVLPGELLGGATALLVPKTADGRVLFAIPWYGKLLVGTTDVPVDFPQLEPVPRWSEVEFLLDHVSRYLVRPVEIADILSVFAGQRPLLQASKSRATSRLARDHRIEVLRDGLVTVAGGKWTTYRKMAELAVNQAARLAELPRVACQTHSLALTGGTDVPTCQATVEVMPGADNAIMDRWMREDPLMRKPLHERLPYVAAHVVWSVQYELACTVEDVLARRTRALFLDAKAACEAAPFVAQVMASLLNKNAEWQQAQVREFLDLAEHYLFRGIASKVG